MSTMQLFGIQETYTGYWVTSAKYGSLGDFNKEVSIFAQEKNAEQAIKEINKSIKIQALVESEESDALIWGTHINHAYQQLFIRNISFNVVPLNVTPVQ
jgi:hypothetical protein